MVAKFHGKKYYTAFASKKLAQNAKDLLTTDKKFKALAKETFHVSKVDNQFVLYSDAEAGTFSEKKRAAWTAFQDACYKLKKKGA